MEIKGTHAIVTGGCRRIGLAVTKALLERGAKVTVTYNQSVSDFQILSKKYPSCRGVQMDFTNLDSIRSACTKVQGGFGPPDILINNASTFFPKSVEAVTFNDWDTLHSTNVKGHFFFTQGLLPHFKKGVILNITDIHSEVPLKNFSAYVPQKAALRMLTKNLALELAPHIRVNSISPGSILFPEGFSEEQKARHLENCLLGREGSPNDIVEAVFFLIQNDYITGTDLKVDGGSSLIVA